MILHKRPDGTFYVDQVKKEHESKEQEFDQNDQIYPVNVEESGGFQNLDARGMTTSEFLKGNFQDTADNQQKSPEVEEQRNFLYEAIESDSMKKKASVTVSLNFMNDQ